MTSKADPKAPSAPAPPAARGGAALGVAEFIGSFPDPLTTFDPPLPEVAFLGRSNVGKSSLLNALVGTRGLAKVSSTPGKTQTMNVFRIGGKPGEGVGARRRAADARGTKHEARPYYLVDLPGYGYAKTSKTERARFATLIQGFLTLRTSVTGLVWLLDIRHEPSAEDRGMAELLGERGLPALVVLTKADKLGTEVRRTQTRMIARALRLNEEQIEVTSSKSGDGIPALRAAIASALDDPGE